MVTVMYWLAVLLTGVLGVLYLYATVTYPFKTDANRKTGMFIAMVLFLDLALLIGGRQWYV